MDMAWIDYNKLVNTIVIMKDIKLSAGGFVGKMSNEFTHFEYIDAFLPSCCSYIPRELDCRNLNAIIVAKVYKVAFDKEQRISGILSRTDLIKQEYQLDFEPTLWEDNCEEVSQREFDEDDFVITKENFKFIKEHFYTHEELDELYYAQLQAENEIKACDRFIGDQESMIMSALSNGYGDIYGF